MMKKCALVIIFLIFAPVSPRAECLGDGVALFNSGKFEEAEKILAKCDGSSAKSYVMYYLAKALIKSGKASEAALLLQDLIKRYPNFAAKDQALALQAEAHVLSGDPSAALFVMKKRFGDRRKGHVPMKFGDHMIEAAAYSAMQRTGEASMALRQASQKVSSPKEWEKLKSFAQKEGLSLELGIYEDAVEALYDSGYWQYSGQLANEGMKSWPHSTRLELAVGKAAYRNDDYEKAARIFEGLKARGEEGILSLLATTYAKLNRYEDAIAIRKHLLHSARGYGRIELLYKIAALYQDAGDYDKALEEWKHLLAMQCKKNSRYRANALWAIGWALFQKKDYPAARKQWAELEKSRADSAKIGDARIDYWTARSYDMEGNKDEAMSKYRQLAQGKDYYGWLSKYRLEGKEMKDVPVPSPRGHNCKRPNLNYRSSIPGAEDVEEILRAELKMQDSPEAVSKALDKQFYDISYRLGLGIMRSYLDTEPHDGMSCLAWESVYPRAYENIISGIITKKMRPELIWAMMMTESTFNRYAVSPVGAKGLMQLMPDTASKIAKSLSVTGDLNLLDPKVNIPLGVAYVGELLNEFKIPHAVASYNAGEAAVRRWLARRNSWEWDMFVEEIPYTETQAYVKKVMIRFWNYIKNRGM